MDKIRDFSYIDYLIKKLLFLLSKIETLQCHLMKKGNKLFDKFCKFSIN